MTGGIPDGRLRLLLGAVLLLVLSSPAGSEPYLVSELGYTVDPPEGWEVLEASDPARVSFADPSHSAVFQVTVLPGDRYDEAAAMFAEVKRDLNARGEGAGYSYSGMDARLADLSFTGSEFRARGYWIFLDGVEHDYLLAAFCSESRYRELHDFLLSALDSFAPSGAERLEPGPVSQFTYPYPGGDPQRDRIPFEGRELSVAREPGEVDANQVVVEREARILATYQQNRAQAWRRYYRAIYRDSFHRLDVLSGALASALGPAAAPQEAARRLLKWVQGFRYTRTGTVSDLTCPLGAALDLSGDCDSRALVYVILLHHLHIDAVLMVSARYSHSMVGVDVTGKGARFQVGGRGYLAAEVTEPVALGLIASDMADPSKWIAVPLAAVEEAAPAGAGY